MNRAFLIIGIPALVVSFYWTAFGWGLRVAIPLALIELALATGAVIYLRRRRPQAGR